LAVCFLASAAAAVLAATSPAFATGTGNERAGAAGTGTDVEAEVFSNAADISGVTTLGFCTGTGPGCATVFNVAIPSADPPLAARRLARKSPPDPVFAWTPVFPAATGTPAASIASSPE
jgi:hypothetical protein